MPLHDPTYWTDRFRSTLERYDEALLRPTAGLLLRPRNHWPVEELRERCVAAVANAALIDRRIQALDLPCQRLLAFIGHSRQPCWRLGSLLELLAAVGHVEGPRPVQTLFEAGLLFPELPEGGVRLKSFEQWLGQGAATSFTIIAHPLVAARAVGIDLGLPDLGSAAPVASSDGASSSPGTSSFQEADGLDWPLRLSVLWQCVADGPLRRTQQGDFFKRDFERLRDDPLLNTPSSSGCVDLPMPGLLAIALARVLGLVVEREGETTAAAASLASGETLGEAMASLWSALLRVESWDALDGYRAGPSANSPYPAAYLLALLLLARLGDELGVDPALVEDWVAAHHPHWSPGSRKQIGITTFLLGLAHELRLVQTARPAEGAVRVRLSPVGRWLLGVGSPPPAGAEFPQTLLAQPNLEIIAYRQGLTPRLVSQLGRIAAWKNLGVACTLQLDPHTVYRALESGLTYEDMVQTLERHSTRALPPTVLESLRTWANKRDRITLLPNAVLLEFNSAEDLNEALARGLPAIRLTERLAAVIEEGTIDYKHFRLIGTRDYSLPPEKCVEVEADGVTLTVDPARSDLLLECELPRFAEALERPGADGRRRFRLTPASLSAARSIGWGLPVLETWFQQRAGLPLSPAARLLLTAAEQPTPQLRHYLVLEVASAELADGLMQWPATRLLIESRLGPTVLAVAEANVEPLLQQLRELGIRD